MCILLSMDMKPLFLSGKSLINVMLAVLKKNADFRFQAKGHSMSPFIKDKDIITISPLSINNPATGDIVAVSFQDTKSFIVHRIVDEKDGEFIIKGDNNKSIDGIFKEDQIIGIVTKVERNGVKVWTGGRGTKKFIAFVSKNRLLNNLTRQGLKKIKIIYKTFLS